MSRTLNGVTTLYFGLYERDSTGSERWYYGTGGVVAQRERAGGQGGGGTLVYLTGDHLGSASTVTSDTGAIISRTEYGPWGRERGNGEGSKPTTIDFTGQRKDGTGLLYMGARYYDPVLGRFLSADTVRDGVNPYAYVRNNPLRFTDPTGQSACDICGSDSETESGYVQPPITESANTGGGQSGSSDSSTTESGDGGSYDQAFWDAWFAETDRMLDESRLAATLEALGGGGGGEANCIGGEACDLPMVYAGSKDCNTGDPDCNRYGNCILTGGCNPTFNTACTVGYCSVEVTVVGQFGQTTVNINATSLQSSSGGGGGGGGGGKAVPGDQGVNSGVYVLVDEAGEVRYVGQATNFAERAYGHKVSRDKGDLKFEPVYRIADKDTRTGVENAMITYYDTLRTWPRGLNQISPPMPKGAEYYNNLGRNWIQQYGLPSFPRTKG